jgi:hypothetical protein
MLLSFLCVFSSFHANARITSISSCFFIPFPCWCKYWLHLFYLFSLLSSFASFSMFGLCCAKAFSLHYCNFICVCCLQNVIEPKINSLGCFVFGYLKNMTKHAMNSSKCFLSVLHKIKWNDGTCNQF